MRLAVLLCALAAGPALAQHQPNPSHTPYAGLQHRAVKALSDDQVADLRAGRGMGLALAAELNGYPGPIHVLEHAKSLDLSAGQHARVQALYDAMRGEALPIGERLIEQETELDRQFAARTVTASSLDQTTAEIGRTQAALRAAHLKYHLSMMEVLTPAQVRRYAELRGYGSGGQHGHGAHGRHQK
jgi:Spy/CpxP family protein refolding chaperone